MRFHEIASVSVIDIATSLKRLAFCCALKNLSRWGGGIWGVGCQWAKSSQILRYYLSIWLDFSFFKKLEKGYPPGGQLFLVFEIKIAGLHNAFDFFEQVNYREKKFEFFGFAGSQAVVQDFS